MRDSLKSIAKFFAWVAGIIIVVGAVFRIFLVETAIVAHDGMSPTLSAGDRVVLWRSSDFAIGDVVVCLHPREAGRYVLGRVMGKAGMRIETFRGQLDIAGSRPVVDFRGTRRWLDITTGRVREMRFGIEQLAADEHEFMVDPHETFAIRPVQVTRGLYLIGDNRTYRGEDSRAFGPVDESTCRGKVFMILAPADDRGDDITHSYGALID